MARWVDYGTITDVSDAQEVRTMDTEEVSYMDIATSTEYDIENDSQVPTTKAVYKMIQDNITVVENNIVNLLEGI